MKIISIKQKNKRGTTCIITTMDEQNNNVSTIELSMDIVVKEKLERDKTIDESYRGQLLAAQRIIDAKQQAYKYTIKANKTRKQVVKFLQAQNYSDTEINDVVSFLQDFNLIDDDSFSKKYIKDALLTKNIGAQGLLSKLISKGIDKQTAEHAIQKYYPEDETLSMLNDIVNKKLHSLSSKNKTKEKVRTSIFNHVLAKGFSFDDAKKACQMIEDDD